MGYNHTEAFDLSICNNCLQALGAAAVLKYSAEQGGIAVRAIVSLFLKSLIVEGNKGFITYTFSELGFEEVC